jgi:hypothetical protein
VKYEERWIHFISFRNMCDIQKTCPIGLGPPELHTIDTLMLAGCCPTYSADHSLPIFGND